MALLDRCSHETPLSRVAAGPSWDQVGRIAAIQVQRRNVTEEFADGEMTCCAATFSPPCNDQGPTRELFGSDMR